MFLEIERCAAISSWIGMAQRREGPQFQQIGRAGAREKPVRLVVQRRNAELKDHRSGAHLLTSPPTGGGPKGLRLRRRLCGRGATSLPRAPNVSIIWQSDKRSYAAWTVPRATPR